MTHGSPCGHIHHELLKRRFHSLNFIKALTQTEGRRHLVVQVPRLVVLLRALPAEDGLVVYLDELPLRAVTEMSKKAANR